VEDARAVSVPIPLQYPEKPEDGLSPNFLIGKVFLTDITVIFPPWGTKTWLF
jgi:hypothetical protein